MSIPSIQATGPDEDIDRDDDNPIQIPLPKHTQPQSSSINKKSRGSESLVNQFRSTNRPVKGVQKTEPTSSSSNNNNDGDGDGGGGLFKMVIDERTLYFLEEADYNVAREIQEFRDSNPEENHFLVAMKQFNDRPNHDAITKMIYGNQSYDFIIKFSMKDTKESCADKRRDFQKAMLRAGLFLEYEPAAGDIDRAYWKIVTPFKLMCDQAEKLRLRLPIIEEETSPVQISRMSLRDHLAKLRMGANSAKRVPTACFRTEKLEKYVGGAGPMYDAMMSLFNTTQRTLLTARILDEVTLETGENYQKLLRKGVLTDAYALHDGNWDPDAGNTNIRAQLMRDWAYNWKSRQPTDIVRSYLGEKIAFYFAWLGFYTRALIVAAVIGIVVFFYGIYDAREMGQSLGDVSGAARLFDNALTPVFSFFMCIWATLFLEFWKRKSMILAYRWDMLEFEEEQSIRPEWEPHAVRQSPIHGKLERYEPVEKHKLKILAGILGVCFCVSVVIFAFGGVLLGTAITRGTYPDSSIAVSIGSAIVSLVVIVILQQVYARIAVALNDFENYKTQTQYDNALIFKRFAFDFVNNYATLFYIGFAKAYTQNSLFGNPNWTDKCSTSCLLDLSIQLSIIFVAKQIINQIIEIGLPAVLRYYRENKNKDSAVGPISTDGEKISEPKEQKPWVRDGVLGNYSGIDVEFQEMVLQFGFVTLFVTAFPLGPLFAFINNFIEIRSDAYKLLKENRRPLPFQAQSIGSWFTILNFISHVAVLTNACLIAFTSEYFEWRWLRSYETSSAKLVVRLLFIIAFEHLVFFFKYLLAFIIPDIPKAVQEAIDREKYVADVTIDGEPPAEDDPEALRILRAQSSEV